MLLRFLVYYADDPELRRRFARDPGAVLDEYQVSQEERALFKPLDPEGIEKRMIEQVPEVVDSVLDLEEEWRPVEDIYGPNHPKLRSIDPQEGNTNTAIPFTIHGRLINIDAVAYFARPGLKVFAENIRVDRLGRTLRGSITLVEAGDYNVVVDNGEFEGEDLLGTLTRGFRAKKA